MRPQLLPEPLGESLICRGVFFSPVGWRWLILGRVWPVAGTFSGTFDSRVVAECYLPSDPIHPRASSISVRGRTTRTPSPERKCLMRSEEHTSELQSQSNLVCRLLLEKK